MTHLGPVAIGLQHRKGGLIMLVGNSIAWHVARCSRHDGVAIRGQASRASRYQNQNTASRTFSDSRVRTNAGRGLSVQRGTFPACSRHVSFLLQTLRAARQGSPFVCRVEVFVRGAGEIFERIYRDRTIHESTSSVVTIVRTSRVWRTIAYLP